ncbi:YitT family protein [Paenibacillus sp. GD4]|uniref:YitT family protein n=1 Tax=Paenibacillus sp. GD4 TaxID=3068890 RepID=UPI00279680DF|nr:YitT family protein [Paenibacillus sp. GD4]MDQ1910437.1 YitT family protein [Paenibacillus sp. GD4]
MEAHLGLKARILRLGAILLGVGLISVGLEMFLTPHKIIPGGVKGVAILLSHLTEMKMGLILLFINLPFVLFSRRRSWRTILSSLITLLIVAICSVFMYPFPPLFQNPLPASIAGGLTLGIGIGLIIRFGWYVDGVHDVAFYLQQKTKLTLSEVIMILNILLLASGGFLFGWDQAIHSIFAYYAAFRAVDFTLDFRSRKMVLIHSSCRREVAQTLLQEFRGDIQLLEKEQTRGGQQEHQQLFLVIAGKEVKRLRSTVLRIDPYAQVVVSYSTASHIA